MEEGVVGMEVRENSGPPDLTDLLPPFQSTTAKPLFNEGNNDGASGIQDQFALAN